ncbi:MAG TPA: GntR family transcriptional regulator [Aggregatilineales bacterium]|nr:GntR family transcriptional regulator [Aggregatilineales bacterium]
MDKVTNIVISHNSVVSLHIQLHNQLRQLILSGRWPHGSRIPSETQFAEHLRLSRSTVRLALQQAEIEGLIERTAGRGTFVAYVPSKERRNRLIAFVTSDFDAENHLLIMNGAEGEAKARGYQLIFSRARTVQEEADILKRLQENSAAGLILWPNAAHSHPTYAGGSPPFHLPMVLVDRKIHGFECDCVTSDNYGGAQALMRHLIELGHRSVVFLSHHEMDVSTVKERYRAYRDVSLEAGQIPADPWLIDQPGREPGVSAVLRSSVDSHSADLQTIKRYMLNAQPPPTAIFAVNDYVAILAMRAMKLLSLQIPDAVSIAGFDGTDLAAQLEVPLSTVAQDPFTIGKRATQILVDRIEGYSGPVTCEIIPTQLRVRSSTSVPLRV